MEWLLPETTIGLLAVQLKFKKSIEGIRSEKNFILKFNRQNNNICRQRKA